MPLQGRLEKLVEGPVVLNYYLQEPKSIDREENVLFRHFCIDAVEVIGTDAKHGLQLSEVAALVQLVHVVVVSVHEAN